MPGTGSHCKRQLARIGIVPTPDCPCNRHAAEMDARGTLWCRANRDAIIVPWLREEAKRRGLFARNLYNDPMASLLVERSIRLAEQDGWHADDRSCPTPAPHPDVVCGMTTAPRRAPTLLHSVRSLAAAGYATSVYAEPDSPQLDLLPEWCNVVQRDRKYGAWHNWLDMARTLHRQAVETGAGYVATFQDDIHCSAHLRAMVESFPFSPRNGCLLLYTPSHYYDWERPDHGWRLVTTGALWGLLGVVIRTPDLAKLLDSKVAAEWLGAPPRRNDGESVEDYKARKAARRKSHREHPDRIANVDTAFGKAIHTRMHCHLPSLIMHTAPHSSIGHGGNSGQRNAAGLLTELPPPAQRSTIPPATPKPRQRNGQPTRLILDPAKYGERRKGYRYYHAVRKLIPQRKGTLLDVGSGISQGVEWLRSFPLYRRTSIELIDHGRRLAGVEMIFGDFVEWDDPRRFDIVTCLQVLEHVADPQQFCERLFAKATGSVIISIPYRWPPDQTGEHQRHELDESHLREWTVRDPMQTRIVAEPGKTIDGKRPVQRLVAQYDAA